MLDETKTRKLLESTVSLLNEMRLKYYIDSGTLLSAYRDQKINTYDHDLDIRLMPAQVPEASMGSLVKQLWHIGYRVIVQNYGTRAELICVNTDRIMLDLKFSFEDDNWHWVYCWAQPYSADEPRVHCYPRSFFKELGQISLYDRVYPTPSPIEEYVECHYGKDWRQFKRRPEQEGETDLVWDYMKSPASAMSLAELAELRKNGSSPGAVKSTDGSLIPVKVG